MSTTLTNDDRPGLRQKRVSLVLHDRRERGFLFRLSGRELTDGADAGVVEGMHPWQT